MEILLYACIREHNYCTHLHVHVYVYSAATSVSKVLLRNKEYYSLLINSFQVIVRVPIFSVISLLLCTNNTLYMYIQTSVKAQIDHGLIPILTLCFLIYPPTLHQDGHGEDAHYIHTESEAGGPERHRSEPRTKWRQDW